MPSQLLGAYGTGRYGQLSYGDSWTDSPLVTVSNPSPAQIVTTPGPTLTVAWNYTQAQGLAQGAWRVLITDAAQQTTYYDSGFVFNANTSTAIDPIAAGIPTDTTGSALLVTVQAQSIQGAHYTGAGTQLFDIQWGVVTAVITTPGSGAIYATPPATIPVVWTFASTRGYLQRAFRLRVLYSGSSSALYDSGFVIGAGTTFSIPFTLVNSSSYYIELTLQNTEYARSTPVKSFVQVAALQISAAPVNQNVGNLYDIAINGMGFVMNDDPSQPHWMKLRYLRTTNGLVSPPRLATTDTPFTQAIDRYNFIAFSDFQSGAGQLYLDRAPSIQNQYLDSEGINPFTPFQLTLLNSTSNTNTTAFGTPRGVVVGSTLYVQTGAKQITAYTTPNSVGTTFSIAAATTITDMTTDGQFWYACAGTAGIFRNNAAADPGAAWSTQQAQVISWAGLRICAGVPGAGSTTPNVWTTLTSAGAEEVTGGRVTLPPGFSVTKTTGGTGHTWFGVYSGTQGNAIYHWDPGSDSGTTHVAPTTAFELPGGQTPRALKYYEGGVYLRVDNTVPKGIIYRCITDTSGNLTPTFITDAIATPGAEAAFETSDKFVFFSWPSMTGGGASGVGCFDLQSGGFCKWLYNSDLVGGNVRSIFMWQGMLGFLVDGKGVYYQQTSYVASGFLKTSVSDKDSSLDKVFDTLDLTTQPLAAGQSVTIDYSIDYANSYVTNILALSSVGSTKASTVVDQQMVSLGLKINVSGPGTSTPTVVQANARIHPLGLADIEINLPLACYDEVSGSNGKPLPDNGPGQGMARLRSLEALAQTRIVFQDVDWPVTRSVETYEMESLEIREDSKDYSAHLGHVVMGCVAIVTLRKRLR